MDSGKKEKERWYLDRFMALLPSLRHEGVTSSESPDFVLTRQEGSVGVELTELHRAVSERETPGQAQESMRDHVVARARELFTAFNDEPLYVSVLFNESHPIGKGDVAPLAEKLAALLGENCPAPGERYEQTYDWWDRGPVPEQVQRVAAYNVPSGTRAFFYAPGATWVGTLQAADLQRVLDAKEFKVASYRSKAAETWLVIAHDTNRMSTWFEVAESATQASLTSSFDRVFLLNVFSNKLEELSVIAPESGV